MASADVTVAANEIPVADAGGPYTIHHGDTLYLDGHNSYDPDYGPNSLSYEWDLNEDGTPDLSGATPDIEWSILESTYGYSSNNNYTVSLTVSDGADSAAATAQVAVINDPPEANDSSFSVMHDQLLSVPAPGVLENDYDPNGDSLSVTLVDDVDNGSLTLVSDGSFDYQPAPLFTGEDYFVYEISDGIETAQATVTICVHNSSVVGVSDAYWTMDVIDLVVDAYDGVLANDYDPDGDPLEAILVSSPSHGTLSLNPDGSFQYNADDGYDGYDSFKYKASDSLEETPPVFVSIAVGRVILKRDGKDVTDNETAWVGELIVLQAATKGPVGGVITAYSWTVPDTAVAGYTANNEEGTVSPAEDIPTDGQTLEFYWVDGGPGDGAAKTINVTMTVADTFNVIDNLTIRVKQPVVTVTASTDSSTKIKDDSSAVLGSSLMSFGDGLCPGIYFEASDKPPQGDETPPNGKWVWAQLVDGAF